VLAGDGAQRSAPILARALVRLDSGVATDATVLVAAEIGGPAARASFRER